MRAASSRVRGADGRRQGAWPASGEGSCHYEAHRTAFGYNPGEEAEGVFGAHLGEFIGQEGASAEASR